MLLLFDTVTQKRLCYREVSISLKSSHFQKISISYIISVKAAENIRHPDQAVIISQDQGEDQKRSLGNSNLMASVIRFGAWAAGKTSCTKA